jgi:F0F1-type ATP synthase membrane subunit a
VILNVILAVAVLVALFLLFVTLAVRGLRKFVRSVWPHS